MKKGLIGILGFLAILVFPLLSFAQSGTSGSMPVQSSDVVESDRLIKPGGTGAATAPMQIAPPRPIPNERLPFGQSHFYTITLRGNGDALFSLKTVFSNKEEASMSAVTLTFPSVPQNLSVFQAYREPQCISYKPVPMPLMRDTEQSDLMMRYPYIPPQQECEQYQEPDYSYGWGTMTYHKAEFTLNGTELTVELPKQVKANGNGSLLLSFLLTGVTSKDFLGAYGFSVDTVKVPDTIQNLQAGIQVDPDYYLKDAKGAINYQSRESGMPAPAADAMLGSAGGVVNAQFDQFYNSIGQGTVVKYATNLQPDESYAVAGTYADSRWKLYAREIGIGVGVFVLVLLIAFGIFYFIIKKVFGKRGVSENKPSTGSSYATVLGASFGSSLLIFIYTLGLYFLSYYTSQIVPYYSSNFFYPLFILLLGVISLCIYAALLFAPSIVIGIKRGVVAASVTLVLTIFWLVFFGIVFAGIFFLFFQDKPVSIDYPVSYRGSPGMEMDVKAVPPQATSDQ